jgi:hypothetical protein
MARVFSFGALAVASVAPLVLGCGNENPIPEGEPIPDTGILSCGDDQIGLAAPSGGLSNTLVEVSESASVLSGSVIWQASCPSEESDGQIELSLERITIHRNDAGYPGEELGSADFDMAIVLSCSDRATSQIGGTSETRELGPIEVVSLSGLCAQYAEMPTGMPLFVHVEATGVATTCSAEQSPLVFQSKTGVDCTTP